MSFEREYARAVNEKGKYTYISGYNEKKVKVRHNKCGNVIELSIPGALVETKRDICKACKAGNYKTKNYTPKTKPKQEKTEIEKFCNKEVMRLMETMFQDGYLFGDELKEFVRLSVITYEFALTKYSEQELIDTYMKMIIEKYRKQKIGVCRKCGKVYKGLQEWGGRDRFLYKTCFRCNRKK